MLSGLCLPSSSGVHLNGPSSRFGPLGGSRRVIIVLVCRHYKLGFHLTCPVSPFGNVRRRFKLSFDPYGAFRCVCEACGFSPSNGFAPLPAANFQKSEIN